MDFASAGRSVVLNFPYCRQRYGKPNGTEIKKNNCFNDSGGSGPQ